MAKINWVVLSVIMLMFGTTVVGCSDSRLNGTWNYDNHFLKFKNDRFEYSTYEDGKEIPWKQGTYTTKDDTIIFRQNRMTVLDSNSQPKWYTKDEYIKTFGDTDEFMIKQFDPSTYTYSINGNALNLPLFEPLESIFTKVGNEANFGNDNSKVSVPLYKLGQTGPGGGIIFYYSEEGFKVDGTTCHYLEVAPNDQGTSLAWASTAFSRSHVDTRDTIGSGKKNTELILATDPNAPASKACKNYRGGGKNDWFLPSRAELFKLSENRKYVGNINKTAYWSSSEFTSNPEACGWNFNEDYNRIQYGKEELNAVRAIRAF